jgi:hypothetical protein
MDADDARGTMKTGLLLIATGPMYMDYIRPLLVSAQRHFVEHTPILWTDSQIKFTEQQFHLQDLGYPNATLHRYDIFYAHAGLLTQFDQLFYCDIDMLFVGDVEEKEIFSQGITATLHPGFARERWDTKTGDFVSTRGTPERNPGSTAFISRYANNKYFCGGFNGGDARSYLKMADTIRQNIYKDKLIFGFDFSAVWHDESHLNNYLYHNPPARILTPSFCYPEDYDGGYGWGASEYEPKLLALNKRKKR